MARALVTKLRIPDTAAQTRKSPVARSGRAEASCHDISNTWLAHGYSSSSLTTPATQCGLCARGADERKIGQLWGGLVYALTHLFPSSENGKRFCRTPGGAEVNART